VNLGSIDYIDSAGLGILAGLLTSARNQGGDIKLVSPGERLRQVFRHIKLNAAFRIYQSVNDVVESFPKQLG
jgi:anti-sigma B factor antagonist